MIEFLVLGALAFAAFVVFAVLGSVFWLVFLPFRIMGWILKGLALLVALPFVALFGVVAFLALGAGMLMFLIPFVPFVLLAFGAWWLVKRTRRSAASVTS